MKGRRRESLIVLVISLIVSFTACNGAPHAKPAPTVAVAVVQPALKRVQAPPSSQPTVPAPAPVSQPTPTTSLPAAAPSSETPPPNLNASEKSQTLTFAQQEFHLVTHRQSIPATAKLPADETVDWWELRDSKDKVLYRESYAVAFQNGQFESTTEISANAFDSKQGGGIIVQGMDLPSAPDAGGWLQLFAFKYGPQKYGADESLFMPFGPPIWIEGEYLGLSSDSFTPTPMMGRAMPTVTRDVLKFRTWTGNFNIVYPVQINWIAGKLEPAWHCFESTSKGRVERCTYPVMVDAHRENQPTFVRLFAEPDDGFTAKHVILQPETKIEYLEARLPVTWNEDPKSITFGANGDMWLKIRIDGQEGWIHTEEDFEAVGLPQAG